MAVARVISCGAMQRLTSLTRWAARLTGGDDASGVSLEGKVAGSRGTLQGRGRPVRRGPLRDSERYQEPCHGSEEGKPGDVGFAGTQLTALRYRHEHAE